MSEIRTHEQVVGIIGILAQEAHDDGANEREELGPQTKQAIEWLSATDAALRSALARETERAEKAERERDEAITRTCGAFGITSVPQLAAIATETEETPLDLVVKMINGAHARLAAAESERDRLRERLDQFEAYGITVSSALADRAYVEALGNDLTLTRGAMAADDARLRAAAIRVWGDDYHGCDTPDAMADLIESLRARLAALSHLGTGAGRRAG